MLLPLLTRHHLIQHSNFDKQAMNAVFGFCGIDAPDPKGALAGSVAVFAGALGMSRSEAAALAARAGMTVRAGVTKQTTHLVVGDQDLAVLAGQTKSSKHRKAEDMQSAGHPFCIIGESESKSLVAKSKA